jgi:hypothetical protein
MVLETGSQARSRPTFSTTVRKERKAYSFLISGATSGATIVVMALQDRDDQRRHTPPERLALEAASSAATT